MVTKTGYIATNSQAGINNSNIAIGFYGFGDFWFPYYESKANNILFGNVTRCNFKVISRTLNGNTIASYSDIFYHNIHIVPNIIDLGNIVSSQEFDIYVWNAHFDKKRLNAISRISDGIVLEGQTAPYVFNPLEEQNYKVTVTPEGSSIINDNLIWDFGSENPKLHLTGDRVVAFSFMPNWDNTGVSERLEWATDMLTSETGVEQRSALYAAPRRYLNANFYIVNDERQLLNNMSSWYARNWAIPLWPHIQFIKQPITESDAIIYCDTENIEFKVGGIAFLWLDTFTYEIAEIIAIHNDSIQLKRPLLNNWPSGTRIYPAITAIFSNSPSFGRKTDSFQEVNIEFRAAEVSTYKIEAPNTFYKGYPVFDLLPDESEDLTSEYQQMLSVLDNNMALPRVTDIAKNRFYVQGYRWLAMGREEKMKFKSLLYYLNGQQKTVWIPSHAQDLTVVKIISASEPILTIKNCGYSRFANKDSDKKHIYIWLKDGSIFHRKIINSSNEGSTENLLLDEPLGRQVTPEQILRISYMRLCRLNADNVEIKHIADSEGLASSSIVFRRVIDNEF